MDLILRSTKETKNFAKKFAKKALKMPSQVVFSLEGDLGAGKTTFTQGFAEGLGIKEKIQSPTFVILKIYRVNVSGSSVKQLVHVDAYRLQAKDFKVLGWKEFINPPAGGPQNIVLVEWGNKIKNILPKNTIRVLFKHGKTPKERAINILGRKNNDWEKIVSFGKNGISAKKFLKHIRKNFYYDIS